MGMDTLQVPSPGKEPNSLFQELILECSYFVVKMCAPAPFLKEGRAVDFKGVTLSDGERL